MEKYDVQKTREAVFQFLSKDKAVTKAGSTFSIYEWIEHNECGTTCCIAGAAIEFNMIDEDDMDMFEAANRLCPDGPSIVHTAANLLGIKNYRHAHDLFIPVIHMDKVTPRRAYVALADVIAGNAPNWEKIIRITPEKWDDTLTEGKADG